MKTLQVIHAYFRGIRLSVLFVQVMMTLSIFIAVLAFARVSYIVSDYSIVAGRQMGESYYVQTFIAPGMRADAYDQVTKNLENTVEALSNNDAVNTLLTIRVANPLSYGDYKISIILYDEMLIKYFPKLKQLGISFDDNGCILGSKVFNDLKKNDLVELTFYGQNTVEVKFPVSDKLNYPYKYVFFSDSGTLPTASYLFRSGDCIIMEANEENLSKLSQLTEITYNLNFILSLNTDVSETKRQQLLQELEEDFIVVPLEQMVKNSETEVREEIRKSLLQPLFLLLTSTVSYLSSSILIIKKKEKEFAVSFLCGCSKRKIGLILFAVLSVIASVPVAINLLSIWILPELEWIGLIDLDGFYIDGRCYVLAVGYYLIASLIAITVSMLSIRRHTPLAFLRGAGM